MSKEGLNAEIAEYAEFGTEIEADGFFTTESALRRMRSGQAEDTPRLEGRGKQRPERGGHRSSVAWSGGVAIGVGWLGLVLGGAEGGVFEGGVELAVFGVVGEVEGFEEGVGEIVGGGWRTLNFKKHPGWPTLCDVCKGWALLRSSSSSGLMDQLISFRVHSKEQALRLQGQPSACALG